jgi:hypothetical protein
MPAFKKADARMIICNDVKLKFISTKGNAFGENSFFNVVNKDKLSDILSVFKNDESENEIADLRNEPLSTKQHFPFFMDKDKTDIILKVNITKIISKVTLEKDTVYNTRVEFTHYDFQNKQGEICKGWSCAVVVV